MLTLKNAEWEIKINIFWGVVVGKDKSNVNFVMLTQTNI